MSGEDDTFDIDLYGNEDEQQDLYGQDKTAGEEQNGVADRDQREGVAGADADDEIDWDDPPAEKPPAPKDDQAEPASEAQKQGTKRKAPSDDEEEQSDTTINHQPSEPQAIDPHATTALKLSELHWWTTEEDLRGFCAKAGAESELRDLSFGEHKINGKAKGEAYLEFASPAAASKTKDEIERQAKGESAKKLPYQVWFSGPVNPFRNAKDSGGAVGAARKDFNAPQGGPARGGAYNNFNNRGNFGGRGNFNNNRGGGFGNNNFQNRMPQQQQQQQQAGNWGMNGNFNGGAQGGGYSGMGGFGSMPGMFNPMQMMQGMQGMMGRGGFGGMGMGGMGGMGGGGPGGMRGGGNMMGRGGGGWGGGGGNMMGNGFGGGGGGGGFGQGQGQGNKRPRME